MTNMRWHPRALPPTASRATWRFRHRIVNARCKLNHSNLLYRIYQNLTRILIVRMLAFRCGCAMLLISTSTWPLSRKSATPNNVVPTKDKKYAHYSWISGRCRLTHTDERKHKVTEKSRLPLQRSPGVVSCRVIVSVRVVAGHRAGAAYPFRTIAE